MLKCRFPDPVSIRLPRGGSACKRGALARDVAAQAPEVALATLSDKTAVEVAIVDHQGDILARVGM